MDRRICHQIQLFHGADMILIEGMQQGSLDIAVTEPRSSVFLLLYLERNGMDTRALQQPKHSQESANFMYLKRGGVDRLSPHSAHNRDRAISWSASQNTATPQSA